MHANEYSEILVCPTTRQKLRLATDREIEALRQREGLAKIEAKFLARGRANQDFTVFVGVHFFSVSRYGWVNSIGPSMNSPGKIADLRKPVVLQELDGIRAAASRFALDHDVI